MGVLRRFGPLREAARMLINLFSSWCRSDMPSSRDGRGRAEYWWFVLANIIISIAFNVLAQATDLFLILSFLVSLALLVPGLAVAVRRLHDTSRRWWILIAPSPSSAGSSSSCSWHRDPTPGANQYGLPPPDPDPTGSGCPSIGSSPRAQAPRHRPPLPGAGRPPQQWEGRRKGSHPVVIQLRRGWRRSWTATGCDPSRLPSHRWGGVAGPGRMRTMRGAWARGEEPIERDHPTRPGSGSGCGDPVLVCTRGRFRCQEHDEDDPADEGDQRDEEPPPTPTRVMQAPNGDGEARHEKGQRHQEREDQEQVGCLGQDVNQDRR